MVWPYMGDAILEEENLSYINAWLYSLDNVAF